MDLRPLRQALLNLSIPDVRFYDSIGSTNDEALAWAESGAPDMALVLADQQTSGRGRMGRQWVTVPGAALAFSLVIRPAGGEGEHIPLFSPLAGLSVALVLESYGLSPSIKWPNDVLLGRQKVCGILAESVWSGERLQALVVGVGVNVAPRSVPPAESLLFPATCVESELGSPVDRLGLLQAILIAFQAWRKDIGSQRFVAAWEKRLAFRGEQVVVQPPGADAVVGELAGVDRDGNLSLRLASGKNILLAAGDVHLRPVQN